ncbi:MAG: serine hydrolase [Anaerolineaceae bacterium]|nr:serine hydrolase [Anaerolineaceae bacterium]
MTVTGLGTRQRKRRRLPIIQILSVLMLLAAIAMFVIELVGFSQQQERLPADVSVAGVRVGNLLPREATTYLDEAYSQPVVLYYRENPILLDPSVVGFRSNNEVMLASARSTRDVEASFWLRFINYLLGREAAAVIDIPLSADYQQNLLEQYLRDIAARYNRSAGDAEFDLQTLTLRSGSGGYVLDVDSAIPLVDAALRRPDNRVVELPITEAVAQGGNIETLRAMIVAYLDSQGFIYDGQTSVGSVFIIDLTTGEEVNILGDVAFSAASTAKVEILIDYFRHLWFPVPQDEAYLMANSLLCSNNSSSNLMMEIIGERSGGQRDIFAGLQDMVENTQYIGAENTYITAPFVLGIEGQQFGSIPAPQTSPNANFNTSADPYNQTTAEDMGTMFTMMYDCANYGSGLMAAYPDGEFTQTECRQMLELMSANDLLRLLQGGIPEGVRISHKNGWISDMVGDAGIVYPPNGRNYVIAVYLWEQAEFQDFNRLWPLVEGVSRAAWNYFNPETPLVAARTDLPETAQACDNFLPPPELLDLNNINGWRSQ